MPQSRAVLNTNTFIVMDVAAEALLQLQVSAVLLVAQNLTFVNSAFELVILQRGGSNSLHLVN